MNEKEDIRGEAERALARIKCSHKIPSHSHSYLRSVADGRFSLLKPSRIKQNRKQ